MMSAVREVQETEIDLIRRAARGDSEAFAALFDQHYRQVYHYALWLCNDADLAEDLTQETFIRAHRNLHRLGPPWKIHSWLCRLARNLYIDYCRREPASQPLSLDSPLPASEPDPERQVLLAELSGPVRNALQRLSPNYREALVLREVEGFHYDDIADIMGVSLDNVKVLLHRARASFKESYGLRLLAEEPLPRCEVLAELLDALHDKEPLGDQEALVRAHLKDCPTCQQRRRELAALLILFRAQPVFEPPRGLRERLLRRMAAHRGRRLIRLAGGGMALAAILVIWWFAFGPSGGGMGGGGEPAETPPAIAPAIYHAPTPTAPACVCGDGVCEQARCQEFTQNCPADCGPNPGSNPGPTPDPCAKSCGNGVCEPNCNESPNSCPADCAQP